MIIVPAEIEAYRILSQYYGWDLTTDDAGWKYKEAADKIMQLAAQIQAERLSASMNEVTDDL